MASKLAVIDRLIEEHQTGVLRESGRGLSASNVLFILQKAQSQWVQADINMISTGKKQLLNALIEIRDQLDMHHLHEENALWPLCGERFVRARMFDHVEIRMQIQKVMLAVNNCNFEGLCRREILERKAFLEESVSVLCLKLVQHANLEDQMLQSLRKSFEDEERLTRSTQVAA